MAALGGQNRLQNQAAWIGLGFGTEDITTPLLPGQEGVVVIKAGKAYQFVQFKSTTTTIANGTPVGWTDKANFVVSAKNTDLVRNAPAGVSLGTQTASNWGWIQVQGPHTAILVAGGASDPLIATGAALILGSSTDGVTISTAAGTAPVCVPLGYNTAASTGSGSVAGVIAPPPNGW